MPISRERFDKGIDEATEIILGIFTFNNEEAFTMDEIVKATDLPSMTVSMALINLVNRQLIEGKFVGIDYYYSLRKKQKKP